MGRGPNVHYCSEVIGLEQPFDHRRVPLGVV